MDNLKIIMEQKYWQLVKRSGQRFSDVADPVLAVPRKISEQELYPNTNSSSVKSPV